ncbi:MAG: hypothetical protein ACI310_00040 [Bacilli bacterium]
MTQINYKSSTMINYTLADLQNALNYLNIAINTSNSLNIPSDFEEIQYLKNLPENLNKYLNLINRFNDWIRINDNKYNKITTEFKKSIDSINDVIIEKRIGYINKK